MARIDPESERQRLADFYSRQMDGRLEKIAGEAAELTPLAREVLKQELARRGLNVELPPQAAEKEHPKEESRPASLNLREAGEKPASGIEQPRDLIVIRRFRDLPEALLAKGSLDSSGIESFLLDDNTVRIDWFWSNLLGGIKLLVDTKNVEAANEILRQPISEELELEGTEVYRQPHCPNCQSLDVNFQELYKPIAFGSLFVNFPLPVHRRGWICHACRHDWWDEEPRLTGETPTS